MASKRRGSDSWYRIVYDGRKTIDFENQTGYILGRRRKKGDDGIGWVMRSCQGYRLWVAHIKCSQKPHVMVNIAMLPSIDATTDILTRRILAP